MSILTLTSKESFMKFRGIIISSDDKTISQCFEICSEIGIALVRKKEFAGFILDLQENEYDIIICDCTDGFTVCHNWVKIIKRISPKIPLIILNEKTNPQEGGILYQEGIFNLTEKPIDTNIIKEIITATIPFYKQQ
jgi:DNA-binding NtrC family response regulator